jgi:hypothetical protein
MSRFLDADEYPLTINFLDANLIGTQGFLRPDLYRGQGQDRWIDWGPLLQSLSSTEAALVGAVDHLRILESRGTLVSGYPWNETFRGYVQKLLGP